MFWFALKYVPRLIVPVGTLLWSFKSTVVAASVFVVYSATIYGYFRLIELMRKTRGMDLSRFTSDEQSAINEYYVALCWPNVARDTAGILGGAGAAVFVWVPWLLYRHLWWHAGVLVVLNIFSMRLATRLNPGWVLPKLAPSNEKLARDHAALFGLEERLGPGWIHRELGI